MEEFLRYGEGETAEVARFLGYEKAERITMSKTNERFLSSSDMLLRPIAADAEAKLYAQTGYYARRVALVATWTEVPEGWIGEVADTSWDHIGEDVRLVAGDKVRLLKAGSPIRLALIEVIRNDS
jgi:hypothetical protein